MERRRPIEAIAVSFATTHPEAAARVLAGLPAPEAAAFLERCPAPVAAAVADELTAQECMACFRAFPGRVGAEVLAEMAAGRMAAALRRATAEERSRFLDSLAEEQARQVRTLLRYEEGSAGALMEAAVYSVRAEATVAEVLGSMGRDSRQLRYYLYAVDSGDRLLGVLDMRRLMGADPEARVATLMDTEVLRLSARARREAILRHPGWDVVHALPVVDESNVLVGVVSYGTIRGLARSEPAGSAPSSVLGSLGELYWSGTQRVAAELLTLTRRRVS